MYVRRSPARCHMAEDVAAVLADRGQHRAEHPLLEGLGLGELRAGDEGLEAVL